MAPYIAHYVNCKENLAVLYSFIRHYYSIMQFQPCEGRKLVLLIWNTAGTLQCDHGSSCSICNPDDHYVYLHAEILC